MVGQGGRPAKTKLPTHVLTPESDSRPAHWYRALSKLPSAHLNSEKKLSKHGVVHLPEDPDRLAGSRDRC